VYSCESLFYDNSSFANKISNASKPTFLSLNVQSLQNKHESLLSFVNDVSSKNADIDIIILQEIWQIPDLSLIQIPNYDFVFKKRARFRGGGVGYYVKKGIQFKVIESMSCFVEKTFECLTIEIKLNGKKMLISNFYRPPTPPPWGNTHSTL
jgi:exonuclease III